MTTDEEHEMYLKKILSRSLSSASPSEETIKKHYNVSRSYFDEYKFELLDKYKDKTFKDFDGVKVVGSDYGETLEITHKKKINFKLEDNHIKEDLLKDFKVLPGVGVSKEDKLKKEGYNDLYDLEENLLYGEKAKSTIKTIENADFYDLFNILKRHRYDHHSKNNTIKCASYIDAENLKFMDIETLGLSNVPIILIGMAEIKGNKIISYQYLLRDKVEEPAVITSYLNRLDDDSVHVTYNGASFDVPFIKNRARFYQIDCGKEHLHYDLIFNTRNLWKDKLPDCKLTTIENHICGFERFNDVPGQYIPGYYDAYLKRDNIGPLVPIVKHNRMDITSLADFFMKIYNEVSF